MTDNGSAYRSTVHAIACRALGINPNKAHYNNNGQPLPIARDDCFPIDGVLV